MVNEDENGIAEWFKHHHKTFHSNTHSNDDLNKLIVPFRIKATAIPASNLLSDPRIFAPEPDYIWDIMRLTAQTFTAGNVVAYHNSPQDDQIVQWTGQAGSYWFENHSLLVTDRSDALVFQGTSLTGTAYISAAGLSVHKSIIGKYLLG